ncbi:MAG: hypothetical protein JW850_15180 [Thermoflexales bacterium]|nr:hypothetical protein [Thermoflexales bacterium]
MEWTFVKDDQPLEIGRIHNTPAPTHYWFAGVFPLGALRFRLALSMLCQAIRLAVTGKFAIRRID